MKIAVFCSANDNISPEYFEKTRELATWLASRKHAIVFGGCNLGLMECLAETSRKAGCTTLGVVPELIERGGKTSKNIDVFIPCANLYDRKEIMNNYSSAAIALPGGIGTLDEIFCVAASATIGYIKNPVILYNIGGFWDSLIAMLDDLEAKNMIRGDWHSVIKVATSLDDIAHILAVVEAELQ